MPTPTESRTSLSSIFPIDISVIVIARSSVSRTWLSRTVATAKCVTIPSRPPTTVQPSTRLGRRSAENEMSIPCTYAPGVTPSIHGIVRDITAERLQAQQRDRCLKSFEDDSITLAEEGGDIVWGRAKLYTTGLELRYAAPVEAVEGHVEQSFIFYKDEYPKIEALFRVPEGLTAEDWRRYWPR